MKAKAVDFNKLALNLSAARMAAEAVTRGISDEGTVNQDHATLEFRRMPLPAAREQYLSAVVAAGLSARWHDGKRKCLLITPPFGQGGKRTKGAEVMFNTLKNEGWNASLWYQMD